MSDKKEIRGAKRLLHSPNKARRRYRYGIPLLALAALVLLFSLIWWMFFTGNGSKAPEEAQEQNRLDALELLGSSAVNLPQHKEIRSSLGFSLTVDESLMEVSGQVTDPASDSDFVFGESFEGDELNEERAYSIIKAKLIDASSNQISIPPDLSIVTNIRESFWDDKVEEGETQIEALVRWAGRNYTSDLGWDEPVSEDVTINSYRYIRSEYTQTTTFDDLEFKLFIRQLVTVQEGRPYIITIASFREGSLDLAEQLESVVNTVSYGGLDSTQLSLNPADIVTAVLSATDGDDVIEDVSNTPFEIDEDTVFDVILRNQPAVVRVATVRCADLSVRGSAGSTELGLGCMAGVGSGSIISEDGYVATNGHVVSLEDSSLLSGYLAFADSSSLASERVDTMLDHLTQEGIVSLAGASSVRTSLLSGQLDIASFVGAFVDAVSESAIEISNDDYTYVLQLGTDAFKLQVQDGLGTIDVSGETLVEAELIAQDYEANGTGGLILGDGEASDVAVLKVEKGDFPVVELGSIDDLKPGDGITAIGYPAFVDGGLATTSDTTTPTVTQGNVLNVFAESSTKDNVLIATSTPISGGNSGGPAFDESGIQVGLNTYAQIECADQNCFGAGVARDVKDLISLVDEEGIDLDVTSDISDNWDEALESYEQSNYKGAAKQFDKVDDKYPSHYLATRLQSLSESKIGSPGDRSSEFENNTVLYLILGSVAVLVLGGGSLTAFLLHGSHKHNKDQRPVLAQQQPDNPSDLASIHAPQQLVAPTAPKATPTTVAPSIPQPPVPPGVTTSPATTLAPGAPSAPSPATAVPQPLQPPVPPQAPSPSSQSSQQ